MFDFMHKLGSPPHFWRLSGAIGPWFGWASVLLIVAGLFGGLVLAPEDYQQKDAFRIIYFHVPSAWLSMFAYMVMAGAAAVGLVWRFMFDTDLGVVNWLLDSTGSAASSANR